MSWLCWGDLEASVFSSIREGTAGPFSLENHVLHSWETVLFLWSLSSPLSPFLSFWSTYMEIRLLQFMFFSLSHFLSLCLFALLLRKFSSTSSSTLPLKFFISVRFLIFKTLKTFLIDSISFLCIWYTIISLRLTIVLENSFTLHGLFPPSALFLSFLFQLRLYSKVCSLLLSQSLTVEKEAPKSWWEALWTEVGSPAPSL